jgi:regulator of protease activity HflC (stomatin/prohibitin superfamily)/uncharacterized protein YjeT (DUF2065 family)
MSYPPPSTEASRSAVHARRTALLLTLVLGLPSAALTALHLASAPLPALALAWLGLLLWFFTHALHAWFWQHATLADLAARAYETSRLARSQNQPDKTYPGLDGTLVYAPPSWLPGYARTGQRLVFLLGALATLACGWAAYRSTDVLTTLPDTSLRLLGVVTLVLTAAFAFLAAYLRALGDPSGKRSPLRAALRLLAIAQVLVAFTAFALLYAGISFERFALWPILALLLVLPLETLLSSLLGHLKRPSAADSSPNLPLRLGLSLLLDAFESWRHPLDLATERLQSGLGIRLDHSWIHHFLRRRLGWIAAAGLLAVWSSTALTVVPADSQGVRLRLGLFGSAALPPGLHASLPWPLGRIEIVPTERIRETVLGFEQDLGGPILWTEKHYEGERTLLVGDGGELLTINVPLHYRIADPLLQLRATGDPAALVRGIAEARLVRLAVTRESFQLMLGERSTLAETLRTEVQAELTTLHTGIELVWVGIKDIHPPVEVTPDYQAVISAQEERESLVLDARTTRAALLPEARREASRLRTEAEAAARERTLLADADTARLRALAALPATALPAWREVRHLEALEHVLPPLNKVVVSATTPAAAESSWLDLRPAPVLPAPAPIQ